MILRKYLACAFIFFLFNCTANNGDLLEKAKNLTAKGDFEASNIVLSKILDNDSTIAEAWNLIGINYFELENYPLASAGVLKAVALDPSDYRFYYNLGNVRREQKLFEESFQLYERALSIKPDVADIYLNRGVLYSKVGSPFKAIKEFEVAAKLEPKNPLILFNKGRTQLILNDVAGSIETLEAAIEINSKNPEYYFWLGNAYYTASDTAKACMNFKISQEKGSESAEATYPLLCN